MQSFLGCSFAMQGLGQLAAALMLLIVTAGFRDSLRTAPKAASCSTTVACVSAIDKMWRIVVGFGAVPACIALYCRLSFFSFVQRDSTANLSVPSSPHHPRDAALHVRRRPDGQAGRCRHRGRSRPAHRGGGRAREGLVEGVCCTLPQVAEPQGPPGDGPLLVFPGTNFTHSLSLSLKTMARKTATHGTGRRMIRTGQNHP